MPPAPVVLVAPWTDDTAGAQVWFDDEDGLGQDGILAKRADQPYLSGERGWVKVKHRRTLDVVIGGYRLSKTRDGVGALLLGLYDDDGTLHYVGHTSSFKAAERREMLAELRKLEGPSFEGGRAPGGPSRWTAGRDLEWVAIEPVLVAEVTIDRMQYGRFRHAATFVRWRDDRQPGSVRFEQLGVEPPQWPERRRDRGKVVWSRTSYARPSLQLVLAGLHAVARARRSSVVVEDLLGLREHLAFLFLDVVLEVLLHDGELGHPGLVARLDALDLGHHHVDDVVLLVALEGEILRLRVLLERRVEDLLLDRLVHLELGLQLGEALRCGSSRLARSCPRGRTASS